LSTACLKKFTEQEREKYPQATMVLSQDFYMDDVLSACDNVTEAFKLQDDLTALLGSAGFPLRKWCSNHPTLLEDVLTAAQEIVLPCQLNGEDKVKILGLCWHPTLNKLTIANSKESQL
jgi:hypothetical protein